MKRIELDRLVTISIFARMYPNSQNGRGVSSQYIYKAMGEQTSEKNRINPAIINISGQKFIYLNDYALNLLNLTFEQARELIDIEVKKSGSIRSEVNKLSKPGRYKKPAGTAEGSENNDFYIET